MRWRLAALVTCALVTTTACHDGGTGPSSSGATLLGRVQETTSVSTASPVAASPAGAAGQATAATVAAGELSSTGTFTAVAEADVQADGSFRIENVPAGRADLVIAAMTDVGDVVGRVLVTEETQEGVEARTAPISAETTLKTATWERVEAQGNASVSSPAEVTLLLHPGATASAAVLTNAEVDATATGVATWGRTLSSVFASQGVTLDAPTRASLISEAAVAYAGARYDGVDGEAAALSFLDDALDAWTGADASLEQAVVATAAASSTFDAALDGHSSARGPLLADGVILNLKARERLAAKFQGSTEGSVALAVMNVLAETEAQARGATTAAELRAALDVGAQASATATVEDMVQFLVPGAGEVLQTQVSALAQAAIHTAAIDVRLTSVTTAQGAVNALADYVTEVHDAVQALVTASGRTDLDVNALTSILIAAHGGAYVRTT